MNTLEAARLNYIIESSSRISEIKHCFEDINKVQTIENTESLKGSRNMQVFLFLLFVTGACIVTYNYYNKRKQQDYPT